ncbi:MAG: precorrin-3B C(17)-methyltransferase [Deltaproteobacteria bacterium]|nr:precorrin-3B C(17)-methyltransferase [Deltaproteobacteria bacterium]
MDKKKNIGQGDCGGLKGVVYVVGIGPGGLSHLSDKAKDALSSSGCIVGYTRYVELIAPFIKGKEVFTTGMTREKERCQTAIRLALTGHTVSVVSSGDAGIYGMAGLILQLAEGAGMESPAYKGGPGGIMKIEVIPGVPAFVSAAALLGAPIMHDFACISLSDLLTPWQKIEERLEAAAKGDFVIILYNPKSRKRTQGLNKALDIIRALRHKDTPAGIVRNATRDGEEVIITSLSGIKEHYGSIDMLTIILIGNSTTFTKGGWMITPRGYKGL